MISVFQRLCGMVIPQNGEEMTDGQLLEQFVNQRDEAAFEALMRLHGSMVLSVCKRVLRDHHDAEEAFQATFLVLSNKAASIMPRNRVGNWLYGVAYRTALNAKKLRDRRRTREIQGLNIPEPETNQRDQWQEIAPLLDRELNCLPEMYRVPVVLCDLEGRSCKEVAHELGCPEGTLSSRLTRARSLLAKRLGRRGVVLSVGTLAVSLSQNAASAAVPNSLIMPVIQATQFSALPQSIASGVISPNVAEITEGVLRSMFYSTLKQTAFGLVLMAGLGCGMIGVLHRILATEPIPQQPAAEVQAPEPPSIIGMRMDDATFHYVGTVIDEHGVPAEGAKIWLDYFRKEAFPINRQPLAVTDKQGKFEFSRKISDFADGGEPRTWIESKLVAAKDGHGVVVGLPLDFETTGQIKAELPPGFRSKGEVFWGPKSNVLKLVADDVPVRGRILNSKGLPVAGAEIETLTVYGGSDGTLEKWEEEAKKPGAHWFSEPVVVHLRKISGGHVNLNDVRSVPIAKTNADGYFTLNGLGRDRLAQIAVRGPGIETAVLSVRSRPGKIIKLDRDREPDFGFDIHYSNEFTHKLGPSIPVEGTVTDMKTGQPQANVIVRAKRIASHSTGGGVETNVIQTLTDTQGHYRLEGLPLGKNSYELIPPIGSNCQNGFVTVETTLNSKSALQVAAQALPEGAAIGMAKKPEPAQPSPVITHADTAPIRFSHVFIVGNVILLAGLAAFLIVKRQRSQ